MTVTCTSAFDSDTASNLKETPRGRQDKMNKQRPCQRGDSYIRDGYMITIEEIYHVNGRKKKKVKKKKLDKQGFRADADALLSIPNINIDQEIKAIKDIGAQTRELQARA